MYSKILSFVQAFELCAFTYVLTEIMFLIFDDQKVDGVKSMYTASPKLRQITPSIKNMTRINFFMIYYRNSLRRSSEIYSQFVNFPGIHAFKIAVYLPILV